MKVSHDGRKCLNVLLVSPIYIKHPSLVDLLAKKSDREPARFSIPQGLLSIAASARKIHGDRFKFNVLDLSKELYLFCKNTKRRTTTITGFIDNIIAEKVIEVPDVVGISLNFSTGHRAAITLSQCLKKIWPNVKVVFGGNHSTNWTYKLLKHSSIDYVIRGQADYSFPEFLECLADQNDPTLIQGVVGEPKEILTNSIAVTNMDDLPMMAYDLLDMETYITDTGRTKKTSGSRTLSYLFSRGCSNRCTFCSSHTVHGRKVITKSSKKSISELKELVKRYDINVVVVEDDLFGVNKKIFYEFCDELEASGLKLRFVFPNAFSVNVLNEKMIDRLVDIGLTLAVLAVESGSKHVQGKIIKKNCNLDKAVKLAKYIRTKGVEVLAYFVMGFPGESKKMMEETKAIAINMQLDWAEFFIANPLVGSEMKDQLYDSGVIDDEVFSNIIDNTDSMCRLYDTPEISGRDLEDYVYDCNIQVNFFGNYNMHLGNYDLLLSDQVNTSFTKILSNYPFHIVALACRARCHLRNNDVSSMENDHNQIYKLLENQHPEAIKLNERYGEQITQFINDTLALAKTFSKQLRNSKSFLMKTV